MNDAQRFMIVKTSSIGDIIHSFPVLEYLKKKFPQCTIDWVVEKGCYDLVKSHPMVHNVFWMDTKGWRKKIFSLSIWKEIFAFIRSIRERKYDVIFDLQGNIKSAFVTTLVRSPKKVGFAYSSLREKPNLLATNRRYKVDLKQNVRFRHLDLLRKFFSDEKEFVYQGIVLTLSEEDRARLTQIMKSLSADNLPTILVAFGSKWENKRLSKETLKAFLEKVFAKCNAKFLFIWASEEEHAIADDLCENFPKSLSLGKMSLPLLQALIYQVAAVIAMDSGVLHLCGTTTTPSFSIFGPSSSLVYKPEGKMHVAVQGPCPYGKKFVSHCPILRTCPTGACIKDLTAGELAQRFLSFWQEK